MSFYKAEHISEPWFSLIVLGWKNIECRKNHGRFKEMKIGDIIQFVNNDFLPRTISVLIVRKKEYSNFKDCLITENLHKILPGMDKYNLNTALSVYRKYYTIEDEEKYGVIAIEFELLDEYLDVQ